MSHRIYLASRYSRRTELIGYAAALRQLGHEVTASWLFEAPAWDDDGIWIADSAVVNRRVAAQDTDDIDAADTLIGFLEEAGAPNRGGKDREIGYAMGRGKRVLLVGSARPCVFDFHPAVIYCETWQACLDYLQEHELAAVG